MTKLLTLTLLMTLTANLSVAQAQTGILGCDPRVLERGRVMTDAYMSVSDEIVKATYQKPTPIEMMSCVDQRAELISSAGGLHANPGGDISASIAPYVSQPIMQSVQNAVNNIVGNVNAIANNIASSFSGVVSNFSSMLGGLSVGAAPTLNCNMTQQTWLTSQCLDLPQVPDLTSVLQGKLAEVGGGIADLVDPTRYAEMVCRQANSTIQGYIGDLNSNFDTAVDAISDPITDSIN